MKIRVDIFVEKKIKDSENFDRKEKRSRQVEVDRIIRIQSIYFDRKNK